MPTYTNQILIKITPEFEEKIERAQKIERITSNRSDYLRGIINKHCEKIEESMLKKLPFINDVILNKLLWVVVHKNSEFNSHSRKLIRLSEFVEYIQNEIEELFRTYQDKCWKVDKDHNSIPYIYDFNIENIINLSKSIIDDEFYRHFKKIIQKGMPLSSPEGSVFYYTHQHLEVNKENLIKNGFLQLSPNSYEFERYTIYARTIWNSEINEKDRDFFKEYPDRVISWPQDIYNGNK